MENIGNGLKTIYARFSDISMGETVDGDVDLGKVTETLEKVGVTVINSEGKMRDVGTIMEDLMGVWQQLDITQKNAIASTLAGKYQLSRFNALMNRSDLYEDYKSASMNAEGTMDEMNEKYLDSLEGRLKSLQTSFEGLFMNLFDTAPLYEFIDGLSSAIDAINTLVESIGGAGTAFTGIMALGTKAFSSAIGRGIANSKFNRDGKQLAKENALAKARLIDELGASADEDKWTDTQRFAIRQTVKMHEKMPIMNDEQVEKGNHLQEEYITSATKAEEQRYRARVLVEEAQEQLHSVLNSLNPELVTARQMLSEALQAPVVKAKDVEYLRKEIAEMEIHGGYEDIRQFFPVGDDGLPETGALKMFLANAQRDIGAGEDFITKEQAEQLQVKHSFAADTLSSLLRTLNAYGDNLISAEQSLRAGKYDTLEGKRVRTDEEILDNHGREDEIRVNKKDKKVDFIKGESLEKKGQELLMEAFEKAIQSPDFSSKKIEEFQALKDRFLLTREGVQQGTQTIGDLQSVVQNIARELAIALEAQINLANGSNPLKTVSNVENGLDSAIDDARRARGYADHAGEAWSGYNQQLDFQDKSTTLVSTASAVGDLAFAWQSFQSLGSLFVNSDLEAGEKVIQTVTNLAATFPMLIMGATDLKDALGGKEFKEAVSDVAGSLDELGLGRGAKGKGRTAISLFDDIVFGAGKSEVAVRGLGVAFKGLLGSMPVLLGLSLAIDAIAMSLSAMKQAEEEKKQAVLDKGSDALSKIEFLNDSNGKASVEKYQGLYEEFSRTREVTDELKNSTVELAKAMGLSIDAEAVRADSIDKINSHLEKQISYTRELAAADLEAAQDQIEKDAQKGQSLTKVNDKPIMDFAQMAQAGSPTATSTLGGELPSNYGQNSLEQHFIDKYESISKGGFTSESSLAQQLGDAKDALLELKDIEADIAMDTSLSDSIRKEKIEEVEALRTIYSDFLRDNGKEFTENAQALAEQEFQGMKDQLSASQLSLDEARAKMLENDNIRDFVLSQGEEAGKLYVDGLLASIGYNLETGEIAAPQFFDTTGTADVSGLAEINKQKSSIDSLVEKYQKSKEGAFSQDEAAELIGENPEYLEYMKRVGDQYYLNRKALLEYNQAIIDQEQALENVRGDDVDLSLQNTNLSRVQDFVGEDVTLGETGRQGVSGALDQIRELNNELMNGSISSEDFVAGLSSSFDGLIAKLQEAGMSAKDFFETASGQNVSQIFADELYQSVQKSSKMFKSGEINVNEYAKTLKVAGRSSIKMAAAQAGLTEEQVEQIEATNDLESITKDMSDSQKTAVKNIKRMSSGLKDLDAASNFNNFVTENFEEVMSVFDNSGHVLEEVKTSNNGIQESYRGTIEKTATQIAGYYKQNETAATEMASVISDQFGYTEEEAKTLITSGNELATEMMNNSELAGAVMSGTAARTTSAISSMSQGLSAIIQSMVMSITGIDATVVGTPQETSGNSFPIKTTVGGKTVEAASGSMVVPGFRLNIKGQGSSGGGAGTTRGATKYENGEYKTEVFQDSSGGANDGLMTYDDATAAEVGAWGAEQFGKGFSDFMANGGMGQFAPSKPAPSSGFGGGGGGGGRGGGGGKGGKGGGGGGGGKTYTPKEKDPLEEETDRYERVETLLDAVDKDLEKIAQEQDRLTGFAALDNMEKQVTILHRQIDLHKEKLEIQKQEAQELKGLLATEYGISFDTEGFMTNYQAIHQQLINDVNALIAQYNAATTEDAQENLEKQIEAAEKRLEKFKDKYKRYDELVANEMKETSNAIEDLKNQIEDFYIDAFKRRMEVVDNIKDVTETLLELDGVFSGLGSDDPFRGMATSAAKLQNYFSAARIDMNKYYDNLIARMEEELAKEGKTAEQKEALQREIAKAKKARDEQFEKDGDGNIKVDKNGNPIIKKNVDDYGSGYFDMSKQTMDLLLEQARQFEETGSSAIFGENSSALYEAIKEAFDQGAGLIQDFEAELDNLRDQILDAIEEIDEQWQRRSEGYENITAELEHQYDLIEMIQGEKAYDNLGQALDAKVNNYNAQILDTQKMIDGWEKAKASMKEGSEEWLAVNQKIIDAQEQIRDLTTSSIEAIQQKYQLMVDKSLDTWTQGAFGTGDLDWVQTQWELINRNADYYLDDVNKAYNIQKLQGKYLEMLDNANGLHLQQQITDQMSQQLEYLRDKKNLSEYDVAYANAQLEILQKRIALEEAQRNKSQMKLRRDTQGNYSYVYSANEGDVRQAEGDLLDAQNNAYNLSKEQMKQTQADSLSALQDAKGLLSNVWSDATSTLEEKKARTEIILSSLREYLDATSEQLSTSEKNIINDFLDHVDTMNKENTAGLQETYDQLQAGNASAFDAIDTRFDTSISNWLSNLDKFSTSTDTTFSSLVTSFEGYKAQLGTLSEAIGQSFTDGITKPIDEAVKKTEALVTSSQTFFTLLTEQIGTVQQYETTLADMAAQITAANNNMAAYKKSFDELAEKYANVERENEALKQIISGGGSTGSSDNGDGSSKGENARAGDVVGFRGQYYYSSDGMTPRGHNFAGKANAVRISSFSGSPYGNGRTFGDWKVHIETLQGNHLGWVKPSQLFDTGGYTGSWGADGNPETKNGKLAWLHQKELVLNATDTENILEAVRTVRSLADLFKQQALGSFTVNEQLLGKMSSTNSNKEIQQNVHITAEFPAVNSSAEIENALLGLNDRAVQYAFKQV